MASGKIPSFYECWLEDIVDTGLTVKFLRNRMEEAAPTSVMYVTLLLKNEVANLDFPIDYVGFNDAALYVPEDGEKPIPYPSNPYVNVAQRKVSVLTEIE